MEFPLKIYRGNEDAGKERDFILEAYSRIAKHFLNNNSEEVILTIERETDLKNCIIMLIIPPPNNDNGKFLDEEYLTEFIDKLLNCNSKPSGILAVSFYEKLSDFPESLQFLEDIFKPNFDHITIPFSSIYTIIDKVKCLQRKEKSRSLDIKWQGIGKIIARSKCERKYIFHWLYSPLKSRNDLEHNILSNIEYHDFFNECGSRTKDLSQLTKLNIQSCQQDYAECLQGLIKDPRPDLATKKLNVLLIDNNPDKFIQTLRWHGEIYSYNVYKIFGDEAYIPGSPIEHSFENSLSNLISEINNQYQSDLPPITCTLIDGTPRKDEKNLRDFDLILLDLHLGEKTGVHGQFILSGLLNSHPEIPIFILSAFKDPDTIHKMVRQGADGYVTKINLLTLPAKINQYFEEIGRVIWLIKADDVRRNFIGNFRRWKFRPDTLWFGDKCYHMIEHAVKHARNNWQITNQMLPPILTNLREKLNFRDEDLYALYMAVWLHDIGHKGNERYGEPHQIRDVHGLISAEIIMRFPEHYGIYGVTKDKPSPYRWISFAEKSVLQVIRDRIFALRAAADMNGRGSADMFKHLSEITILEKIALLCIYHQSNFPIDELEVNKMLKERKKPPKDCYENYNRATIPITLESICSLLGNNNLLHLVSLFRFIDSMDINENRVGDATEESIKIKTIERDRNYYLLKLENEVKNISHYNLAGTGKEKRFYTLFYERVEQEIYEKGGVTKELKKEQQNFLDGLPMEINLDNYTSLSEYICFLAVQSGHFKLHNSIQHIKIEELCPSYVKNDNPKIGLQIIFFSNKTREILDDKKIQVKKWDQENGRTIQEHIVGLDAKEAHKRKEKQAGYVRRELNSGERYLKELFDIDNINIRIRDHEGKILFEEPSQDR